MTKEKLLELLKAEALPIDEKTLLKKLDSLNAEMAGDREVSPAQKLSKYNLETMLELKNKAFGKSLTNEAEFIDDTDIQMLKSAIDSYMDRYAEGQKELKIFIRIIAVYLTFIAKKPLHPESMFYADGKTIYRNGNVVCPLRVHELTKPGSLCRFCVCIS
ncbi:MAG: DUF2115 domain-containing protein [Spirochaetaceae bacterium]|jgi:uncharacterized protein (UPF0305 family)|nr:DUF2115 domain-containing protein [Spirochaetaceae bacterium]